MEAETRNRKKRVLSWVLVAVIVFVLAGMILPMFSRTRESTRCYILCRFRLRDLLEAEIAWADKHEGRFSERLSDLYPEYVTHLSVFLCPSAAGPEIRRKEDIDSLTNYVLRKGLTTASPPDEVLIYEHPSNHGKDDEYVAFVNGDIRRVDAVKLREIMQRESET